MKASDSVILFIFGLVFWIGGTILYGVRGPEIFETTNLRYFANFILVPVVAAAACVLIFRWRGIPAPEWAAAALLIALPGMFGEVLVLSRFGTFMRGMQPASAGRYGAFLFAAYAAVLLVAEVVSLRHAR